MNTDFKMLTHFKTGYAKLLALDIIMNKFFIGIDVQTKRDCCYAISASYLLLSGVKEVKLDIDFSNCLPGHKDVMDAFVASVTVREFTRGKGIEVGNGDGLGAIILPRPLPESLLPEVLTWP